jgi:hypothetical protein
VPYSSRFFVGTCEADQIVVYTVPADYVAVIRDVEWFNDSGSTIGICYLVTTIPGPLSAVVCAVDELPTTSGSHWDGRVVLEAGDTLSTPGLGTSVFVHISGYLLSAP